MPKSSSRSAGGGSSPLSPLLHGRVRLLVLSHLWRVDQPVPFTTLRDRWQLTDGTLSVHLSKLEKAGIVALDRRFVNKRPQTLVRLTTAGKRQYRNYQAELREIVFDLDG